MFNFVVVGRNAMLYYDPMTFDEASFMIQNLVSLISIPCSLEKNVALFFLGVFL